MSDCGSHVDTSTRLRFPYTVGCAKQTRSVNSDVGSFHENVGHWKVPDGIYQNRGTTAEREAADLETTSTRRRRQKSHADVGKVVQVTNIIERVSESSQTSPEQSKDEKKKRRGGKDERRNQSVAKVLRGLEKRVTKCSRPLGTEKVERNNNDKHGFGTEIAEFLHAETPGRAEIHAAHFDIE